MSLAEWTIVKPAKGFHWFTSDNPVVKLNFQSAEQYDLRGGWGRLNGNIIFPLGPEHAMFCQIGQDSIWRRGYQLSIDLTLKFRKYFAENARQKIFSQQVDSSFPNLRPRVVDAKLLEKEREDSIVAREKFDIRA